MPGLMRVGKVGGMGHALTKGGGAPDYLAQWIGASTYAEWSAKVLGTMWQDGAETTPVTASGDRVGSWNSRIGGYGAKNATPSQRLNLLISGTRHTLTSDAADDNLLTTWFASSGGNTIFIDVDVPATVSASAVVFGASGTGGGRISVGFNAAGKLCAGVGSIGSGTIVGASDFRGQRCAAALTLDGSTVKLFTLTGGEEYSAAQSGVPITSVAARIAANNNPSNVVNQWFGGGIARVIPVQKGGLTLSDWQNIGPQLAAAGA